MAHGKILLVRKTAKGQAGVIEPLRGANVPFSIVGGDFTSGEAVEFKLKDGEVVQITRIKKGEYKKAGAKAREGSWGRFRPRRDARSYY
ncbi:hypothetical protein KY340_00485 [Candidatus Woesearchaeota archaeon]|nr:hypothetical protein [Candidatus Woesearchaeota archaeon]